MNAIRRARSICYGDNVDTDVIIPARYLNISDRRQLAAHAMEDIDQSFAGRVRQGDAIVAGSNFGCGSSREHAPQVLKDSGIALIVAKSFARIFYRNAINIGLAVVECAGAAEATREGDEISFLPAEGVLTNHTLSLSWDVAPYPPFVKGIIDAGGLAALAKSGLEAWR
jgi:3-isopropylmalate/(R)-2-methylmalate dehydratase small subunit